MRLRKAIQEASLGFVLIFIALSVAFPVEAADKENCLMCHKYLFVGRIDENGKRHTYHVDEKTYNNSVHRNVACRDCHTYITKIPHDPVTEEVNCATTCHHVHTTNPQLSKGKLRHPFDALCYSCHDK